MEYERHSSDKSLSSLGIPRRNQPRKISSLCRISWTSHEKRRSNIFGSRYSYLVREEGVATRTVLIEWPSREAADAGYNSPEYQEAIRVLDGAATREFRYMDAL